MTRSDRLTLDHSKPFDVVALGAAIVDVLALVDDAFLETHGMAKNSMTLIDSAKAEAIYGGMSDPKQISGGSAANTLAGIGALGGKTAFAGKVRDDVLGRYFAEDIRKIGVEFETRPFAADHADATARSMILVTPDAHRTMCTSLGVSGHLRVEDLPMEAIKSAKIVYLEGYLWDNEDTKNAFRAAMKAAKDAGCAVSLTLSDAFCVDRHRDSFLDIINGPVDILFANEAELLSLYETEDFEAATAALAKVVPLGIITRSEKGCIVVSGDERIECPAEPIDNLVDTTGAGDQFAAGFFHGLIQKQDHETCARMGCASAAEVIQHLGARPEADMKALYKARGLA